MKHLLYMNSLTNNFKLDKNKKYLLACSCGPDSNALFCILAKNGYDFEVAFVNYKTRTNSDDEEKLVEELCKKYNVKLHKLVVDHKITKNFEDEARKIRYDFFFKIINESKEDMILLTAHHMDDNIETYLMNLKKGKITKYVGIAGFSEVNGVKIERPLLNFEKLYLLDYLDENNFPYSIDYTNFEDIHDRNKIRKVVNQMDNLTKLSIVDEINKKNEHIEKLYSEINSIDLYDPISRYKYDSEDFCRVIYYLINKITKKSIKGSVIKDYVLKSVQNKSVNNNYLELENGYLLYLEYEEMRFIKKEDLNKTYILNKEEAINILGLNNQKYAGSAEILVIPVINFDSILVDGKVVKTRRFFINCKIPKDFRHLWPCIVDSKTKNVIFVPRYRFDYVKKENQDLNFEVKDLFMRL